MGPTRQCLTSSYLSFLVSFSPLSLSIPPFSFSPTDAETEGESHGAAVVGAATATATAAVAAVEEGGEVEGARSDGHRMESVRAGGWRWRPRHDDGDGAVVTRPGGAGVRWRLPGSTVASVTFRPREGGG
jgi:hypothetical protein